MKRTLSLLLSLILMCGVLVPAVQAEEPADRPVTNDTQTTYRINRIDGEDCRVEVTDFTTGHQIEEAAAGTMINIYAQVSPERDFDHWEIEGLALSEEMAQRDSVVFNMPANDITVKAVTRPGRIPFTDIHPDDWFYGPVLWAYEAGIVRGVTETEFAPRQWSTRAQAATILVNSLIIRVSADGLENPFTDVEPGDWYYDSIVWGYHNDIIKGKTESIFAPNELISRAQFVTMIWRHDGSLPAKGECDFVDVPADAYYHDAVCWGKETGLVNGLDAEHFGPEQPLTRAEATAMMYRMKN